MSNHNHTFNPHDGFCDSYCTSQDQNILEACCCSTCIYTFVLNEHQPFDKHTKICGTPFLTPQSCITACVVGLCLGNAWQPFMGMLARCNHGDKQDQKCINVCCHEFCCPCCAPCAMAKYVKERPQGLSLNLDNATLLP